MINIKNEFKKTPDDLKYSPEQLNPQTFNKDMDGMVGYLYYAYSYLRDFASEFVLKEKLIDQFNIMRSFGSKYKGKYESTRSPRYLYGDVVTKLNGDCADVYLKLNNGPSSDISSSNFIRLNESEFTLASRNYIYSNDSTEFRNSTGRYFTVPNGRGFVNSTDFPLLVSINLKLYSPPVSLEARVGSNIAETNTLVWKIRYNQSSNGTEYENMHIIVPPSNFFVIKILEKGNNSITINDFVKDIYLLQYDGQNDINTILNNRLFKPIEIGEPPTSYNPSNFLGRAYRFSSWATKFPKYLTNFANTAYNLAISAGGVGKFNADKFKQDEPFNKGDIAADGQILYVSPRDNSPRTDINNWDLVTTCEGNSIGRIGSRWIPYVTKEQIGCKKQRVPNVYYVNDTNIAIMVSITIGSGALENYALEANINVDDKYSANVHIREGDVLFGSVDHVQRTIMTIVPPGSRYRLNLYRSSTLATPLGFLDQETCVSAWRELR